MAVFFTRSNTDGTELWAADDAALSNERKVATISPDPTSDPRLTTAGDKVYFAGFDGVNGTEVWVSDGTPAGTGPLGDNNLDGFEVLDDSIFLDGFFYFTAKDGLELWKTDGTSAGTVRLKTTMQGPNAIDVSSLTAAGGKVYFAGGFNEIWVTDGTEIGTVKVTDTGGAEFIQAFLAVGNNLVFTTVDGTGVQVRVTDGTAAGTTILAGSPADFTGVNLSLLASVGGNVYLTADDAVHGTELWKADVATGQVGLVKDLNPGTPNSIIAPLGEFQGKFFFIDFASAFDATGDIWKSDGTDAGTVVAISASVLPDTPFGLTITDSGLTFFNDLGAGGLEIWHSDGTTGGTGKVTTIHAGPERFVLTSEAVEGNVVYFAGDAGEGMQIWRTDGTAAGSFEVTQVEPAGEARFSDLNAAGGKLYFAGDAGFGNAIFFSEPYVSDGTPGSTHLLKVISQNPSQPFAQPEEFTAIGSTVYFIADDGFEGRDIWRTDGTEAGTVRVKNVDPGVSSSGDAPHELTVFGGLLYFVGESDPFSGPRMWRSDGTEAGTNPIDLGTVGTGPSAQLRSVSDLFPAASKMFYSAAGDDGFSQFWVSGSAGPGPSDIQLTASAQGFPTGRAAVIGDSLFFDFVDTAHGEELWISDGTVVGAHLIKDINAGTANASIRLMTPVGSEVYFLAANDSSGNLKLWKSDGTDAGTVLVKDARVPADNEMVALDGKLFFIGSDSATGGELWVSDGTDAGTHIVKDIRPGSLGANAFELTVVGDTLYFVSSADGVHSQIWKTDGTEAGTIQVTELFDRPNHLTVTDGHLFFLAGGSIMEIDGSGKAVLVTGAHAVPDIAANGAISLGAPPAGADFHADSNDDYSPRGDDDVLFQHVGDGRLIFAAMDQGAFAGWGAATAPIGDLTVGGSGDINGDGYADIVVQGSDGHLFIAEQNGSGAPNWVQIDTGRDASWKLVGVADLNHDGRGDAVLQHTSDGAIAYANVAGGSLQGVVTVNDHITSDWIVRGFGDINGDGFNDIVIQDNAHGVTLYADMAQGAFDHWAPAVNGLPADWIVRGVGDVNGDGHADIVYQTMNGLPGLPAGSVYWADLSSGTVTWGVVSTGITPDWVAKGLADVNDDGRLDVIFQNLVGRAPAGGDPGVPAGIVVYAEVDGDGPNTPHWGEVSAFSGTDWHAV